MLPVVIPFYKNYSQLERCKAHLRATGRSIQLFVYDNSEENIGFTRAVNAGLLKFLDEPAPYILVINQDFYLAPDAIDKMIERMEKSPRCGICSPLQMDGDNVKGAGGADMIPQGKFFCGKAEDFHTDFITHWAEAACWLLRREMIKEIGVLDRNMIMFCSDSDYCLRARLSGWEIWTCVSSRGEHERGATGETEGSLSSQAKHDVGYFYSKWCCGKLFDILDYKDRQLPNTVEGRILLDV